MRVDRHGRAPSLGRQLAEKLRRDILTGALPPGAPVKERDHAMALDVSRTPMREAIRILAEEGLVVLRPSRSPVVANPTLSEVTDDLTVMIALEVLSGRLACAAASDDDLARIAAAHAAIEGDRAEAYTLQFFEMDMAFHTAIVMASHNPSLIRTHGEYVARLWRARYLSASARGERARVIAEHGLIRAALEARDAGAAMSGIEAHLENLVRHVGDVYDESGSRDAPRGTATDRREGP